MSELRYGDGEWSQIFGLYQDRFFRTDEGWRVAGRRYHSLARRFADHVEVFPFPTISEGGR